MEPKFPHISEHFRKAISEIVESIKPEKIICYGSRQFNIGAWTAFDDSSDLNSCISYDILVVTNVKEKRENHEIMEWIKTCDGEYLKLIPIVHSIRTVSDALKRGNKFFKTVCLHGVMLYNKPGTQFDFSNENGTDSSESNLPHWEHYYCIARDFLAGASFYLTSSPAMCAFMLHQAFEHVCIAIIYSRLGYRATFHSLGKLLTLTENFTPLLSAVFPQSTKTEKELFKMLSNAYSDVRYTQNFVISFDNAKVLFERVDELVSKSKEIHENKSVLSKRAINEEL